MNTIPTLTGMVIIILQQLLLPFLTSFVVSIIATYLIRIVAVKLKWIYIPREDRWNNRVVALMGGIAIFLSFFIAFLIFQPHEYLFVSLGAATLFIAGFWDDRFELKPIIKFLIQFLAASLLVAAGYTLSSQWPFWVVLPLTYIWIIGITNAFNLLDNMDGLAAGIAVIVSLIFGGLAFKLGLPAVATFCFILAAAAGGFLVFNSNPAKIFMGDCGSLFIGYLLAAFPLMLEPALSEISVASVLPVLVAITILPIFDTSLVTFVRIFKGRSPSRGGSDHTSHRLVFAGLSEKAAVNILYGITAYFGLITLLLYPGNIQLFYLILTVSLVGLLFFGLYLSRLEVYESKEMSAIETIVESIPSYVKQKMQLITIIVDVALIIVSFALAHFIRFEGWPPGVEEAVINVLPGIIVLKILVLAGMGLYKSVWRYAGVADLARLFIGTFVGTLLSGIFAWIYSGGYISASVFAVDLFLFMFLLASSRFAFKGLRRLLALPTNGGRNVLLYGAGDAGWLALSEIRQNPDLNLDPVGFLDDSPYKKNGRIQGLKVLGNFSELIMVCNEHSVDEVLICIRNFPEDKKQMIKIACAKHDIICKIFTPVFDELENKQESKKYTDEFLFQS